MLNTVLLTILKIAGTIFVVGFAACLKFLFHWQNRA